MSNREKGKCKRCGTLAYVEKHHIWPKPFFGGLGPIIELCPNCHTEYHIELGKKQLRNPDTTFHEKSFWKWFKTLNVILIRF